MSSSSSDERQGESNVTTRLAKKARPTPPKVDDAAPIENRRFKVRVPPFSPEEPEIWFALLEGQFENYGIRDDATKFTHVLTNLDLVHAKAVKELIVNPPERHRYNKIKTELIRRLSASHEKKVKQLLTHEELGDRKPSQFLRHLQDLAGPAVPADFIKSIWSQRLPSNIQTLVASQPTLSLEQLADLADHVHDIVTPCNVAAASTSYTATSNIASEIAELKKMVERLSTRLDEHTRGPTTSDHTRGSCCSASRSRSHERRRTPPRQRDRSNSSYKRYPVCYYHHRFGAEARRCSKPCDFKKAENTMGSR
ncbi:uncharacterized protein [Maniola hyperantus]|uniref:uncharacterized protein n=1 Tax=Aphantopus hyperantus TaxID=2795564 RepID=UPI001568E708|nr:uncharacterized protein LOC117984579 [Maniola hyperantus]